MLCAEKKDFSFTNPIRYPTTMKLKSLAKIFLLAFPLLSGSFPNKEIIRGTPEESPCYIYISVSKEKKIYPGPKIFL